MKRWHRIAGLAVGLAATAASAYFIATAWRGQDLSAYASPGAAAGIGVAIAFYVAGVMVSAAAWRTTLVSVGVRNSWIELSGIVSVTQVGKYLPGNVAQHLGRAALAMDRGIGVAAVVVTGVLEVALLALASVAVGGGALLLSGQIAWLGELGDLAVVGCVLLASVSVIAAVVLVRRHGAALVARLAPTHASRIRSAKLPTTPSIAKAWVLYAAVYVAFGIGIAVMARMLLGGADQDPWLLLAAFSLAWIVGFATPGAPAGVGVREAVMLLLLAPAYTPADAGAIVLALRLATTLGDFVLLPIGWWQLRVAAARRARSATTGEPA